MTKDIKINISNDLLFSALVVNTWYSAQSFHLAEHGKLTVDDIKNIRKEVIKEIFSVQKDHRKAILEAQKTQE